MHARLVMLAVVALLVPGCLNAVDSDAVGSNASDAELTPVTSVRERAALPFVTNDEFSRTLEAGAFAVGTPLSVSVAVDLPVGSGLPSAEFHMGVFLPEIPGCDFTAADLPAECKVPVVGDAGPYYGDGDVDALTPAERLGRFLIENLVPHGYAVAQISVFGTGKSGGCMDLMGEVEQAGVQAAVEWLGTQPWSNGNVALIGRSYDGSTPWEAAMAGSEHLKTVVPISGLIGQHELMWRNGSAELRAPGLLWGIYFLDAYMGEDDPALQARQAAENSVCPDSLTGGAQAVAAYATGDKVAPAANGYFTERSFWEAVLENYEGSVYFIHGLEDWNVDPHMIAPFYQKLEAKGLEVKGLFGQWAHNYPDRLEEHESCDGQPELCKAPYSVRHDWAQDLLEWFDHYLKGTGAKPELHVEIQGDDGRWRIEESFPPRDLAWSELPFGEALALQTEEPALVAPATGFLGIPPLQRDVVLQSEPLAADTIISGLPQLHVTVTPAGAGGQLYAELRDAEDGRHIGHAIMDLRYAAGGEEMQPVVPGQPLVARMEFFPLDAFVPAGHKLELRISATGWDYMPSAVSAPVLVHVGPESVLRLPVVERGEDAFFAPPGVTYAESADA